MQLIKLLACKITPVHALKEYGKVTIYLQFSLTLQVDVGELAFWCPSLFGKEPLSTHWIEGGVGNIAGLDALL
jgi:hypothetical protein